MLLVTVRMEWRGLFQLLFTSYLELHSAMRDRPIFIAKWSLIAKVYLNPLVRELYSEMLLAYADSDRHECLENGCPVAKKTKRVENTRRATREM